MPDSPTLLRLMWLASPALPVGGFSYSEGLEAAVEAGRVTNEAQAGDWLVDQLHLALARADAPAAAQAVLAWQAHDLPRATALNDWVLATRETAELRLQAEQMGRSLVEWLRNGAQADDPRVPACAALAPAPTWPVAFALAATLAGADARHALLAFAFASFVWTGENELAIWVLIGAGFGAARYTAKALELDAAVNSGVPDGEAVATLSFGKGACTPVGLLLWSMLITFASVEVTLLVASAGLAAGCAAVWTSYNRHARTAAAPSAS